MRQGGTTALPSGLTTRLGILRERKIAPQALRFSAPRTGPTRPLIHGPLCPENDEPGGREVPPRSSRPETAILGEAHPRGWQSSYSAGVAAGSVAGGGTGATGAAAGAPSTESHPTNETSSTQMSKVTLFVLTCH